MVLDVVQEQTEAEEAALLQGQLVGAEDWVEETEEDKTICLRK